MSSPFSVFAETPLGVLHFFWAFCGLAGQIVALVIAIKRGRTLAELTRTLRAEPRQEPPKPPRLSIWPELLVAFGIIVALQLAWLALAFSHAELIPALNQADPSAKAMFLAKGIAAELNVHLFAAVSLGLQFLVAGFAIGFCVDRRLRAASLGRAITLRRDSQSSDRPPVDDETPFRHAQGLDPRAERGVEAYLLHQSPSAIIVSLCAIAGVLLAICAFNVAHFEANVTRIFGALAAVDPSHKAQMLNAGFAEARASFAPLHFGAGGLLLLLPVVGLVLLLGFGCAKKRRAQLREQDTVRLPSSNRTLYGGLACLALASLFFAFGTPYYGEHTQPIPKNASDLRTTVKGLQTPDFEGSDRLGRWTPVELGKRQMAVDGRRVLTFAELRARIASRLRSRYRYQSSAPKAFTLIADREINGNKLAHVVDAAKHSGVQEIYFASIKHVDQRRPILGLMRFRVISAVRVKLPRAASGSIRTGEEIFELRVDGDASYGDIAAAAVRARRAGKEVIFASQAPPPKSAP